MNDKFDGNGLYRAVNLNYIHTFFEGPGWYAANVYAVVCAINHLAGNIIHLKAKLFSV